MYSFHFNVINYGSLTNEVFWTRLRIIIIIYNISSLSLLSACLLPNSAALLSHTFNPPLVHFLFHNVTFSFSFSATFYTTNFYYWIKIFIGNLTSRIFLHVLTCWILQSVFKISWECNHSSIRFVILHINKCLFCAYGDSK